MRRCGRASRRGAVAAPLGVVARTEGGRVKSGRRPMVPLESSTTIDKSFARLVTPAGPGLLALRHALEFRKPGLWVDATARPESLVLVREGDGGRLEAFGAGEPEPAVDWLVGQNRDFTLLAPEDWREALNDRGGEAEWGEVETWSIKTSYRKTAPESVVARRLSADDRGAFLDSAPGWGLRGWGAFADLIGHGAAFGVPVGDRFAALAWVFDGAETYDAVGAFTDARFRGLGLGKAAASALVRHVIDERRRVPLWSTRRDNEPSRESGAKPWGSRRSPRRPSRGGPPERRIECPF